MKERSMPDSGPLPAFRVLALVASLAGCVVQPAPRPVVDLTDRAPHAMAPTPKERPFDGSLYAPGALSDLASDAVAMKAGDPVVVRFGIKNGYPGIPQSRVTRVMAQVISADRSGSLLIAAQRTIRDSSGTRRLVLVGRIFRESLGPDDEIPVSRVSMIRFRSDRASGTGPSPKFAPPSRGSGPAPGGKAGKKPLAKAPAKPAATGGTGP